MKTFIYFILIILLYSCEDVIDLDLPLKNPQLVIDGLFTNDTSVNKIKLTRTTKYNFKYEPYKEEYEEGAIVIINDNVGNIDTLQESSAGIYVPHEDKIQGVAGRTYKIEIFTQDGRHFESKMEEMPDAPRIDSIYYEKDLNDRLENGGYKFHVYIDMFDPANINNYYWLNGNSYYDGQWHDSRQWNWTFDDTDFDEEFYPKYEVSGGYGLGSWRDRIRSYSITKQTFDFLNLVRLQSWRSNNDDSNIPISVIGNVYNVANPNDYALGYFQVSALTTVEIDIDL